MGVDDLVDLLHKAYRFLQCYHNLLVMRQFIEAEGAALAILEPLMEHLVAADLELPHLGRDTFVIYFIPRSCRCAIFASGPSQWPIESPILVFTDVYYAVSRLVDQFRAKTDIILIGYSFEKHAEQPQGLER